ncbi:uncharacterized protein [Nicotiana tomentosiformis]|uniref:uncharacterized protein n=1 Tax=Nicotiana tomentosiformis TaxID=4098 RepID=UPI00388C614F
MFKVVGKLNRLKKVLLKLNKDKFAEVEKQEDVSMEKLVECQDKIQKELVNEMIFKEEKKLTKQYIYWKEAKINYLQQKIQSTDAVADAFSEFYTRLLGTDQQSRDHVEVKEALCDIEGTKASGPDGYVSQFFKDSSKQDIHNSEQEVKEALWDVEGTKEPGLDRYGSQFIKDSWTIIGEDVTAAVLEFFSIWKNAQSS